MSEQDHRRLGQELELFSFSESVGPGLPLWHPKGALVRHLLETHWRAEHLRRGYDFVYSPHLGRSVLWETSGHLDFYRESMYSPIAVDEQSYYVKPMNCPFHMQIFASRRRSYRELPMRLAELGTVYRYEKSGVLSGLLRVRGFTQDDAHIFCSKEHLEDELSAAVAFAAEFLAVFRFRSLSYSLSTRPAKSVGDDEEWKGAEASLARSLGRAGIEHDLDPGGGAFYGPKLDVHVEDSLGRKWQLSTVQLDFNLPRRFELSYVGADGEGHRPFVLHRALFGSLERFFAILVEHYQGAFPAWLAPLQARLLPVAERHAAKAREYRMRLQESDLRVDLDDRSEPLSARVRDGERDKIPYLLVIGDREVADGSLSVRARGTGRSESFGFGAWLGSVRPELSLNANRSRDGSLRAPEPVESE
jgi:threonyl-tRNA synthetase